MATVNELKAALTDVEAALSFLNTVAGNNIDATVDELQQRSDVLEAESVVMDWLAAAALILIMWDEGGDDYRALLDTIDRLEIAFVGGLWLSVAASKFFLLRLTYMMKWLEGLDNLLEVISYNRYTKKTWISHLATNTCTFCRKLHGTTIDIDDSFAQYATIIGWKRVYGSLRTPPLHPNCQCRLVYS